MSVSDGQPVNASVTNAAYLSRLSDSDTVGEIDLKNVSYTDLISLQRVINEALSSLGMANQTATDAAANDYSSNNVVTNGDNRKVAIGKLDAEFDGTTGHTHDGTAGQGPKVSAANLDNFNNLFAEFGEYTFDSASGTSIDVSSLFTGQTAGGDAVTEGVITSAPNNYIPIVEKTNGGEIEDPQGDRVYGRLTESGGTWTLSFFTNEAGTETAHTLSSQNIRFLYREVFTAANRPTIGANVAVYDTQSAIGDIPDASGTQRGVVSTSAQTFAGAKDFTTRPTINSNDVVDVNQTQTLTNKDYDGGTASNTSRVTLPKNTTAGLDALTDKEATIAYDTDKDTVVFNDGADWNELGAGAGGGGLDVFDTETFEDFTAVNSSGNNASFLGGGTLDGSFSLETTSPISDLQSGKYIAGATSTNDYLEIKTIDLDLKQRATDIKCRLSADMSGFAADVTFVIYDKTNANVITSPNDIMEASGARSFYEFTAFVPSNCTQISYGFHMLDTPTNTEEFIFDDVEFSTAPFTLFDFDNMTDWESYTPTTQGFGTISADEVWWRRVGDSMEIKGRFTAGTVSATGARVGLPTGYSIDTSKTDGNANMIAGLHSTATTSTSSGGFVLVSASVTGELLFSARSVFNNTSVNSMSAANGDIVTGSSLDFVFEARVPIAGWTANTTGVVTPSKANLLEWTAFTPTGTWSNTSYTGFYRRIGDSMDVYIEADVNGAVGAVNLEVDIPSGFTIDFAKLPATTSRQILGNCSWYDSVSTQVYGGQVVWGDPNTVQPRIIRTSGTAASALTPVNNTDIWTKQNGDFVYIRFSVPIVGWDAESQFLAAIPFDEWQTKELQSDQTASGTLSDMTFNNLVIGKEYQFLVQAYFSKTVDQNTSVTVVHNGSTIGRVNHNPSSATSGNGLSAAASGKFTATATTLTFTAGGLTGSAQLLGDGTMAETFAQLTELNFSRETTRFT